MGIKKILAVIIVIAIAFALVSCADNETNGYIPEYETELSETYEGLTLHLWMKSNVIYDEGSLFGDIALQRLKDVKDTYRVNMEIHTDSIDGKLQYYTIAGLDNVCDIVISDSNMMYDEIRADYFRPLDTIEGNINYLDSQKWGSKAHLISYVYNDHLYGVLPMQWPETAYQQCDHFFFVNEDMIASLGFDDPREYVENRTWTRDKYIETLNEYTHKDNNGDTVYALAVKPGHYFSIAIKASGIDYLIKNGDGTYSNDFYL